MTAIITQTVKRNGRRSQRRCHQPCSPDVDAVRHIGNRQLLSRDSGLGGSM